MAPSGSRRPMWPLIVTFAIAFLVLLLLSFHTKLIDVLRDFASTERAPLHPPSCHTNPDLPALADHLPSRTTLFRERPILEDLSPSADEAWEQTLLTRKGGFLWVEFNETSSEAWGISMFHALHCLKMLRIVVRSSEMMKSVVKESRGASDNGRQDGGNSRHPDMNPLHIGHCVGYIAQHLLCAADSTIEPPWFRYDNLGQIIDKGVDGEGYQHQCHDASPLWEAAVKSENAAVKPWQWSLGDTVESIFGL